MPVPAGAADEQPHPDWQRLGPLHAHDCLTDLITCSDDLISLYACSLIVRTQQELALPAHKPYSNRLNIQAYVWRLTFSLITRVSLRCSCSTLWHGRRGRCEARPILVNYLQAHSCLGSLFLLLFLLCSVCIP